MRHDQGQLRAYLDGELSPGESDALVEHLTGCERCRTGLKELRLRSASTASRLDHLPVPPGAPDAHASIVRFHRSRGSEAAHTDPWTTLQRSIEMSKQTLINPRWRPVTVALTVLLTLAVLFSIAPVRNAAADILGLFRVRKFAVIPIDPSQVARLEELAQQAEGLLGEPTVVREPGEEQMVSDAAQASAAAGFNVRLPSALPSAAGLTSFTVQTGPAMRFEAERTMVETLMQAAGMSSGGLPPGDKIAASVDVSAIAVAEYSIGRGRLTLIQAPSPAVDVPEGLDIVALSQAGFQLLGIPGEEARRLATTIDWTSTLVIPLPTNMAQAREVNIDGTSGLLVQESGDEPNPEKMLLWEREGIVYAVNAFGLENATILSIADSLR
jgi:anti-sigma factor RsiW